MTGASRRHPCPPAGWAPAAVIAVVAIVAINGVGACSSVDPGGSPEAAVRHLIASAQAGDRASVYAGLGPRTRGRIEEILNAARKSGAARLLKAEDLVTVGWVPSAWEAANIHEQKRTGDEADVEVASAGGDRQTVRVVREDKRWKVELPLR